MKFFFTWAISTGFLSISLPQLLAQEAALPVATETSHTYVLVPNDLVDIKVYQEDDLATKARIGQDGTISFPLIGVVRIGGKTVAEAGALIRDELGKDYLVNPQVILLVSEYSKRRFTVLGQVEKPGSFEIPSEESVTLLQAIAMAGGYTRLADRANVRVARLVEGKMATFNLNTKREADESQTMSFQILQEDTVTVPERIF
jgi:protein involved in polysaccharide export with SLBB domain